MMAMTHCQDHMLTENIRVVWSRPSYSADKWRCNRCGTYRQTNKRTTREDSATQSMDTGGLVPQHMIEESFRSSADGAVIASRFLRASSGRLVIGKIGRDQKNVEISSQD